MSSKPGEIHQEFFDNPCISSPFGASTNPSSSPKKSRSLSRDNVKSRANLQQWLRLQELHHRIKDCEDEDEKSDLYLSLGDRLCDVGRFTEALCAYGQAFVCHRMDQEVGHEAFVYLMQVISKVIESENLNWTKRRKQAEKKDEIEIEKKYYTATAGDPCADPLSCPSCSGVLNDPVTLPCGHTFCRQHVTSNTSNPTLCYKCKVPWMKGGTKPEEELKTIRTNIVILNLVEKYWSADLKVISLRNEANKVFSSGDYQNAMKMYNVAFSESSDDHLILSNRSVTHLRLNNLIAALEDANHAVALRPDWPKGYLRKGQALKALNQHEEAFKAFFSCLLLEGGNAKPVKLEIAKELLHLLKTQKSNNSKNGSVDSLQSSSNSSSNSLTEMSTFGVGDLPETLRQLGAYLDNNESDQEWLKCNNLQILRPLREVNVELDINDFECPLCMRLLWHPLTTPCGHTFCKMCLDRVMDHNTACPMCKSETLEKVLACGRKLMKNEFLEHVMKSYLPNEYSERLNMNDTEMQQMVGSTGEMKSAQIPIFVCTMAFPCVPCPLHVFEPRYRLMIRRCMELGTREFGMCCSSDNNQPFADYGTMLEVRDIQFFPDGRSIVDTMGGRRFKVVERGIMDGYNTAKVEFLEDDQVPDAELQDLIKLHDSTLKQTTDWFEGQGEDVQKKIVEHYGKLPDTEQDYWTLPGGPTWAWWVLNILPFDSSLKLKLLSITSLKKRLEHTKSILNILVKANRRM